MKTKLITITLVSLVAVLVLVSPLPVLNQTNAQVPPSLGGGPGGPLPGTLNIAISLYAPPYTPDEAIIAVGTNGGMNVPLTAVDFTTGWETMKITEIEVKIVGTVPASAYRNVKLYDGSTQLGPTIATPGATFVIPSVNWIVPANSRKALRLTADLAGIGGEVLTGQTAQFTIEGHKVKAIGETTGIEVIASGNAIGKPMILRKSAPILSTSVDSPSPSSIRIAGHQTLYRWDILVEPAGDWEISLGWKKIVFDIGGSVTIDGTKYTIGYIGSETSMPSTEGVWITDGSVAKLLIPKNSIEVYDGATLLGRSPGVSVTNSPTGSTISAVMNVIDEAIIGDGQTRPYNLKGFLEYGTAPGDIILIRVPSIAKSLITSSYATVASGDASFVWTDRSAPNHSTVTNDWTNDYLVSGIYEKPPLPRVDLKIIDIKPIQTIQDIPLIKDKATMVRVFVDLAPSDIEEMRDVTVELELQEGTLETGFESRIYTLTRNLIRYDGKIYVVPNEKLVEFKKWISSGNEFMIKDMLFKYGLDTFNFEDVNQPKWEGSIDIKATVDPDNEIKEIDEGNNQKFITHKVKSFPQDNYKVHFQRWSKNGDPSDFTRVNTEDAFKIFVRDQFNYLIATYPIPEGTGKLTDDLGLIMSGEMTIPSFLGSCSSFKAAGFDRVVFVVPKDSIIMDYLGLASSLLPCVLVDETAPQQITAHEIGHTYSYKDEHKFWDEKIYPYGPLAGEGWDVRGITYPYFKPKISINSLDPTDSTFNYYSFMRDNCPYCWAPSNEYTHNRYDLLLNKLGIGADPRILIVSGLIYEDDTIELLPFYTIEGIADILEPGEYSFECLSKNGDILSEVSFQAEFTSLILGKKVSPFTFTIPYPNNTAKIILKHYDTMLKEVRVTPNNPVVKIISLKDLDNETYKIVWEASDADKKDILTYSIFYSHNGQDWLPLALSSNDTYYSYTFDTSNLPGGNNPVIKIVTTDGVNTVETISDPFLVLNKPPNVFISKPLDGSVFNEEDEITFEGWAYDPEEFEPNDSSFVWTSNIDGVIGVGKSFTTSGLLLGNHIVTLEASDKGGLSDTDSINIMIATETRPDLTIKGISFKPESVEVNKTVVIMTEISNIITDAFCGVSFYDGDPNSGGTLMINAPTLIMANLITPVSITHDFTIPGIHEIYTVISNCDPEESNITNNKASKLISIFIPAIIDFNPDTLNLENKGKFVTAYIELPEGYEISQIDILSIMLNSLVPVLAKPTEIGDYDGDGTPDLMVKFERSEAQAIFSPEEGVIITLTGKVSYNGSSIDFKGSDIIRVVDPGKGKK